MTIAIETIDESFNSIRLIDPIIRLNLPLVNRRLAERKTCSVACPTSAT